MDISKATTLADFGSGIGTPGSVMQIDDANNRLGIGTDTPQALLQVGTDVTVYGNSGIVSATNLYGDGSTLTGIAATDNIVTNSLKVLGITTFVEDVSIDGSLISGDVTNVDSIGIITAQNDVKVTAGGIDVVGVVTATSFSGDGSNLSGIEVGVKNFVASGTIDNGKTVILKDDGTVGIVTITGDPAGFGTESVFEESDLLTNAYCSVVHDTVNNRIVISYADKDDSYKGKAVVGTIDTSDNSISFGTPVEFHSSAIMASSCAYVGSSKVVMAYQQSHTSYHSYAIVGTVNPSTNTITFGTEVLFYAGYGNDPYVIYDPDNDKVVIVYRDGNDGNYGKAIIGTVDTNTPPSISFGSPCIFNSNSATYYHAGEYIGNSKVVIAYYDSAGSGKGEARVGTVVGTGITFLSSAGVFNNAQTGRAHYIPVISIGNNKVVIPYNNVAGPLTNQAKVGTVSGTSISFGSDTTFLNGSEAYYISGAYDPVGDKVIIAYRDDGNSMYGTSRIGTVDTSANTISFDSPVVFNSARSDQIDVRYDATNDKAVIAYVDFLGGSNNYGTAIVYSFSTLATNLTTENYVGIAPQAIANGATGKINVLGGVNSSQSGLTTAKTYYVGQSGILTTTADTPSVVAGTSISDTKLLVR
tara:strand:+ start:168 stop:2093 length:1926 start_codon:yes stop_codon:yes gene_type:complete